MNQPIARSILRMLSVTEQGAPDNEFWRAFGPRQGTRTLAWLDRSGLALYLREKLRQRDLLDDLPGDVRAHLERRDADNRARVAAIAGQFQAVNSLLAQAGVEFAVLKGFALVPDYCPDPVVRNQYDLDYLINPACRESTAKALRQAGYIPKTSLYAEPVVYYQLAPGGSGGLDPAEKRSAGPAFRPCGVSMRSARQSHKAGKRTLRYITQEAPALQAAEPRGTTTLYSAHLPRPLEVHCKLWDEEEERIPIGELQGVWDRLVQREWQGLAFPSLSDEDGLLFQVLHAFHHVLRNWCRLAVFLEIATFLRQRFADTGLWVRFEERISNARWRPEVSGVVFSLASKLFGAPVPLDLNSRTIGALPPSQTRWVERFGLPSAINNFENNKHSLFLHREFLADPGDWVKIRRRRLFPLHFPPRPPGLVLPPRASSARRSFVRLSYLLRRIGFHLSSGLLYAWERTRQP